MLQPPSSAGSPRLPELPVPMSSPACSSPTWHPHPSPCICISLWRRPRREGQAPMVRLWGRLLPSLQALRLEESFSGRASQRQRTPLFTSRARHTTQPGRSLICARDNVAHQTSPHRGMHSCTIRAEPVQPLSWAPQTRNQTHPEGERHAGIFSVLRHEAASRGGPVICSAFEIPEQSHVQALCLPGLSRRGLGSSGKEPRVAWR